MGPAAFDAVNFVHAILSGFLEDGILASNWILCLLPSLVVICKSEFLASQQHAMIAGIWQILALSNQFSSEWSESKESVALQGMQV